MPRSKQTRITTRVTAPASTTLLVPSQTTRLTTTSITRPSRRKRQRTTPATSPSGPGLAPIPAAYVNSLRNPFEYPPVRLGWGTFVPTQLYTAYVRGSFTTSATDGSFAICLLPSVGATYPNLYINNTNITSTTWSTQSFFNATAIAALSTEMRIVSGGIKVLPQIAATSVPGVLYCGALPSMAPSIVTTNTPQAFSLNPAMKVGYGATGCSSCIAPVDPNSFTFSVSAQVGYQTTNVANTSSAIIIGTGFPWGATVYYEAILNVESIVSAANPNLALQTPEITIEDVTPTLADSFPSAESMWHRLKAFVPSLASVNEASAVIPGALNTVLNLRRAYHQLSGNTRARREYGALPSSGRLMLME